LLVIAIRLLSEQSPEAAMTVKITKRTVDAERPGERDRFIWDSEVKGFGLKITPSKITPIGEERGGKKIYVMQYRMGGRGSPTKRYTIGEHGDGDLTAEKARGDAETLRGKIRSGIDPALERAARKVGALPKRLATIDDLIDEYLVRWARPKKRSAAEDERTLKRELLGRNVKGEPIGEIETSVTWRGRAIGTITRRDIVLLLDRIVDRGSPVQANRTLAAVRRMFNFAIERGLIEASPCVKVRPPGEEKARERNLSDEEIKLLWPALDLAPMEDNIRGLLRFMLVSAQRKGETIYMHEREINRAEATWTIPAERVKNKRDHVVPLSPLALDIIGDERKGTDEERWIFPSSRTGVPYQERSLDHAVRDLYMHRPPAKGRKPSTKPKAPLVLAGFDPFTPHDLRRTAATKMRELGISKDDVKLVLNHKDPSVTGRHYDKYEGLREKRRALDSWARQLTLLIAPVQANVVTLRSTAL
jgi:integrase